VATRDIDSGANPLAHFGNEVQLARQRHKMTQADLGALGHWDKSVVSRVEGALDDPPDGFGEACDRAFPEANGWFARYLRDARKWEGATIVPPWFRPWLDIEKRASVIRWFDRMLVPGLLQTPDYMEAVIRTWKDHTTDQIKHNIEQRIERQAILDRDPPPELWVLIGEHVLHNQIGTRQIMSAQMLRLAEMSQRPHITIQVIPVEVPVYAGLASGALFIGTVDTGEVAHLDNFVQGITMHDPDIVKQAVLIFDRLRAEALPVTASRELLLKVGEEWTE
jgi:hypothetical protein